MRNVLITVMNVKTCLHVMYVLMVSELTYKLSMKQPTNRLVSVLKSVEMEEDLKINVMTDILTQILMSLMDVLLNALLIKDGHALVDQLLSLALVSNLSLKIRLFNRLEL